MIHYQILQTNIIRTTEQTVWGIASENLAVKGLRLTIQFLSVKFIISVISEFLKKWKFTVKLCIIRYYLLLKDTCILLRM